MHIQYVGTLARQWMELFFESIPFPCTKNEDYVWVTDLH